MDEKSGTLTANAGPLSITTEETPQLVENPEEGLHQPAHDAAPPKEDLSAWLQVLGVFLPQPEHLTYYELDFLRSYTSSNIAWIGSTQAFLLFLVSIVAGPICDLGYVLPLLYVGSVLLVVGFFLVSITSAYWQVFLTQAVMMGLGFGCLYVPAPTIVSQYFHASTALAMGVSSAGSAVGGVIFPIIFSQLQPRVGFRWATRTLAFILLITSIIPLLVMKGTPRRRTRNILDRDAFKDIPYLLLTLGFFFGFMGLYIVFYYIQLFALERTNASSNLSEYLLVIINGSSLVGRIICGYYADKIGSVNMQTAMVLISAILTFCMLAIRTAAPLVVFSVLYGFSAGAFMGLPGAGIVSLSPDKSKIGTRLGMTLSVVGIGLLVSNPIAGAILGEDQNWTGLVVWCGVLLFASTASLIASRVAKVGPGLTKAI
ncbi:MFS general substrate transporter [Hypoxylon crocopeplum]|nr:MFS general substrate transporter [Hypoxylon crocopeplum]